MTNSEAIDIIKCLAWHTRPNEEDIEQAIEALKQPFVTDFANKCKECGKILNDKLQTRWIPVSERLPEDEQECLITYKGVLTFHIEVATYSTNLCKVDKYDFHTKKDISGFYGFDKEWGYFEWSDVIAWMPLPQSYVPDTNVGEMAESEGEE